MTTKLFGFILALLAFSTLASQARAAMTIMGYQPCKHDRFYEPQPEGAPARDFIGEGYVWSGVGISWEERIVNEVPEYRSRWVTMISPQYFLTAKHAYPPVGGGVTFYENNSLDGPSHTYTVGAMVANFGDLALGRLTTPIAPEDNITHYPIIYFGEEENYEKYYTNLAFFAYGHGGSHPSSSTDYYNPRVGRNQIDSIVEDKDVGGVETDAMIYKYENPSNGLGDDECRVELGDSGGPSFVTLGDDKLALVGIHWFNYGSIGSSNVGSGDSFVPNYISEIACNSSEDIETFTPLGGDANMDGIVNEIDATILATNWGLLDASWAQGDFDGNGLINEGDTEILMRNWQQTSEISVYGTSPSAVPEPTAAVLLLLGSLFAATLYYCRHK
jgi:hypothetical protein